MGLVERSSDLLDMICANLTPMRNFDSHFVMLSLIANVSETQKYSSFLFDTFLQQFGHTPIIRSADYAWNFKVDPGTALKEFERNRMSNVGPMNAVKNNPAGSAELTPVSLKGFANASVKDILSAEIAGLPREKSDFGFVPMETAGGGQTCVVLKRGEAAITVSLNRKISAVYFLQGMHIASSKRKTLFALSQDYLFGPPIAEYIVNYTDGTRETVQARFGLNILNVTPPVARCRFMSDIRYIWSGKTSTGKDAYLYQQEWVNPHPEKAVASVEFTSAGTEAEAMIFALTTRGVKKELL